MPRHVRPATLHRARQACAMRGAQPLGDDDAKWLADRLIRGVSEQLFGGGVPGQDPIVRTRAYRRGRRAGQHPFVSAAVCFGLANVALFRAVRLHRYPTLRPSISWDS